MNTTIESRVVEMKFDNASFEKGVNQSMGTIDALNKKLNFTGAQEAFGNITKAAGKVDVSQVTDSLSKISSSFSFLEVAAISAINNITSRLVDMGVNAAKAFAFDGLTDGFSEYEKNINSVQTIMNSTGKSVEEVQKELDRLNEYSDRTIYNFGHMADNVSKFTNNGIELTTATDAMMGISNAAALAGADAEEASRAMYNISQSLSMGYMQRIDWKSIEYAHMAGTELKEELLKTAVALGTVRKEGEKYVTTTTNALGKTSDLMSVQEMFSDGLQYRWMTNDVMLDTFNRFSDTSTDIGKRATEAATVIKTFHQLVDTAKEAIGTGWADTFRIIIGNFEEAKKLWTSVSNFINDNIINPSTDARNEMFKEWKNLGGRDDAIAALSSAFHSLFDILGAVKDGFRDIFPPLTGKQLADLTKKFRDFIESIKPSQETLEGFKGTARGLATVLKLLLIPVKMAFGIVSKVLPIAIHLIGTIIKIVGSASNLFADIVQGLSQLSIVQKITGWISAGFTKIVSAIQGFITLINEGFKTKPLDDVSGKVKTLGDVVTNVAGHFKRAWHGIQNIWNALTNAIKNSALGDFFRNLGNVVVNVANAMGTAFNAVIGWFKKVGGFLKSSGILDFFQKLWEIIKKVAVSIKEGIVKNFNGLMEEFKAGDFSSVVEMLAGILGGSLGLSLTGIAKNFKGILGNFKSFTDGANKFKESIIQILNALKGPIDAFAKEIKSEALWNIAKSIGVLAASLFLLSLVDPKKLIPATAAMTGIVVTLKTVMTDLDKLSAGAAKTLGRSGALIGIAISLLILAKTLKTLAEMDPKNIAISLVAVTILISELTGVLRYLNEQAASSEAKSIVGVGALIAMAISIRILCYSMKSIAKLDPWALAASVAAISILIYELAAITAYLNEFPGQNGKAAGTVAIMVATAYSVAELVKAVRKLGKMDQGTMWSSLAGISLMLIELTAMTKLLSKPSNFEDSLGAITILISFSFAITKLASAVVKLGKMSSGESWRGFAGITIILSELTIMMMVFKKMNITATDKLSMLEKIGIMIAMAIALRILVSAVKSLGEMGLWNMAKGLVGLDAMVMILGNCVRYLSSGKLNAKQAVGNAAALAIIAGSMAIVVGDLALLALIDAKKLATAVIAFSAALVVLAYTLNNLHTNPKAASSLVIAAAGVVALAIGLRLLATMDVTGATVAVSALMAVMVGMALVAKSTASIQGPMRELAITMVIFGAGVAAFAAAAYLFAGALLALSTATAGGLAAIVSAITAVGTAIIGLIPLLAIELIAAFKEILLGLIDLLPTFATFVKDLIITICGVINDCAPTVIATFFDLIMLVLDNLIKNVGPIVDKIMTIIIDVIEGVAKRMPELVGAVFDLFMGIVTGVIEAIKNADGVSIQALVEAIMALMSILLIAAGFVVTAALAITGIALAMVAVTELIALLALIGGIGQIPGLQWIVSEGGKFLKLIGEAIGGFIGGFVGSVIEGFSDHLPAIGKNLSDFMTNLKPFLDAAQSLDANTLQGVDLLSNVILKLTAAEMMDGLTSWLTGGNPLSKFGKQLEEFGESFAGFNESTKGLNYDSVIKVAQAIEMLGNASQHIPKTGGIISWFTGNTDWDGFRNNMPLFGSGISDFSKNLGKNFNIDKVTGGAKALAAIADACQKAPAKDGLWQVIFGEQDVSGFASNLTELGVGMGEFSKAVGSKNFNVEKVTSGSSALGGILENLSNVPSTGGLLQGLFGEQDLTKFSDNLAALGTGISNFSDNISDSVKGDNLTAATTALGNITSAIANIPVDGGGWQWISGSVNVTKFAENLPILAVGLVGFSKILSGQGEIGSSIGSFKGDSAIKAVDVLAQIVDAASKIPNEGGAISWFTGDNTLKTLANNIKDFITTLNGVPDANIDSAKTLASYVNTISPALNKLSEIKIDNVTGLSNAVKSSGVEAVNAFLAPFNDKSSEIQNAASNMFANAKKGIDNKKSELYTAASNAANEAVKGAKTRVTDMWVVGDNISQGLINGIKNKIASGSIYAAGAAAAMEAIRGAKSKKGADQNSPSRKTIKVGLGIGEGLEVGMERSTSSVYAAGATLGDTAVQAVNGTVSRIAKAINSNIDARPTITPVLDLSDISSKAGSINSMLSNQPVRLSGSFANVSSSIADSNSRSNSVENAINKLSDKLSGQNGDTYVINGVSYTENEDFGSAVKTIVRTVRAGRRS